MSLITNNDFSYWDLSKTNVFQNFSETYSSTLWLLQKKTNSLWLSWERNPKDTVIFGFMFAIGMQKDIHFNIEGLQNTVSLQILF